MAINLVINGLASHYKGRLFNGRDLPTKDDRTSISAGSDDAVGVYARDNYTGRYYDIDLGLGLTESADDITINSAVCKVNMKKTIVQTAVAGRDGTVKEMISAQDFEIEVSATLINTEDEYPADAVRALSDLARENRAVYVDSAFLRLFDIDRAVVKELEVSQSTWGNTQEITLTMDSDADYEVEVTQSV